MPQYPNIQVYYVPPPYVHHVKLRDKRGFYDLHLKPEEPPSNSSFTEIPGAYEIDKTPCVKGKTKSHWRQIKRSGAIRFTPHRREKVVVENYPVYIPEYALSYHHQYYEDIVSWERDKEGIMRYDTDRYDVGPVFLMTKWGRLVQSMSGLPIVKCGGSDQIEIERFMNECRSDVISAAFRTYDAGTELAEAMETARTGIGLISKATNPLRAYRDARRALLRNNRLSKRELVKKLGDLWMECRYGLMPIWYSLKDLQKLAKLADRKYQTYRASRNLSFDSVPPGLDSLKGIHLYTREITKVRIHAMGKNRFDGVPFGSVLRDQVGFNPFVTAWEKVPYSFVVDWFANVGDWILSRTASLVPSEVQRAFCQSVKITSTRETRVRYVIDDENRRTWSEQHADLSRVGGVDTYPIYQRVDECIQREVCESYTRSIFQPSDVELIIGPPNMSWKRMIDAFVMSSRPLINGLRSLHR